MVKPTPSGCRYRAMTSSEAHRELHNLNGLISARGKTIEEQAVLIANLVSDLQEQDATISGQAKEIKSLQASLKEAAQELTNYLGLTDRQARSVERVEGEKATLKTERNGLRKEVDRLSNLLEAKRQTALTHLFDIETLNAEIDRLHKELVRNADVAEKRINDYADRLRSVAAERNALRLVKVKPGQESVLLHYTYTKPTGAQWRVTELSNRPIAGDRHRYYVTLACSDVMEIDPQAVAYAKSLAEMTVGQHYTSKVATGDVDPSVITYSTSLPTYNTLPDRGVSFVVTLTFK